MGLRRTATTGAAAAALLAGTALGAPLASAADITAPTVPTGLRQIGTSQGQDVYGWDASYDDTGVSWYAIRLDGQMVRKDTKRTQQVRVYDLYLYCHAMPGHSYSLTIDAVDAAGNHSAPSKAVTITVH